MTPATIAAFSTRPVLFEQRELAIVADQLSFGQVNALTVNSVYRSNGWCATTCLRRLRLLGLIEPKGSKISDKGMQVRAYLKANPAKVPQSEQGAK